MSTATPSSLPDIQADTRSRHILRVTLLTLAAVVVGTVAIVALLYQQRQPWVEIIGKDLLRTNASSRTIALARDSVIQKHQNWIIDENGKRSDPSYQGGARTWSTGSSQQDTRVKVTRGKTQITDKNAATLSIETIAATDAPTLVFIDCTAPIEVQTILNDLVNELISNGAKAL